jgi:hypothetical protein
VPALLKVAALLVAAAVVGTFTGLVWGAAGVLERREAPTAVLTPAPAGSSSTPAADRR